MTTDKLHLWEKAPIVGLFVAQGAYVWQWYVGARMPAELAGALGWLAALAGLAAWAAIDGAMIATVAGMRAGRRSRWSWLAIVITAAFGAAVALDLYGAISGASAWLHAGFALTIVCYLLHLAAPKAAHRRAPAHARSARRAWRLRRELRAGAALLRTTRAELAEARAEADTARALAAQEAGRARHFQEAARAAEEQAAQATGLDARTVAQWLAQGGMPGREIARRLGVGESTVRGWLKAPAQRASAAD